MIELRSPTPRLFFSTEEASSNPSSKVQQSLFSDFPPPNQLSPPPEALGKKRKGLKYLSNGPRPSEVQLLRLNHHLFILPPLM